MRTHDPTIIAALVKALQSVERMGLDAKQLAADVYDSLEQDGFRIVSDPGSD
jgi:hypothetical protein